MLKQIVNYTDYNDAAAEETLYFNLTKTEIADNLDLKDELEKIQKSFQGDPRTLEPHEVRAILDLVKRLIKLSYGVRSEDGKRFIKTDEQWTEFTQTAMYDEFLFSLFKEPQNAYAFILGIMPQDIRAEAEAMAKASPNQQSLLSDSDSDLPSAPLPLTPPVSAPSPSPTPTTPDNITQLLSDTTDGLGEIVSVTPNNTLGNHGQDDTRPAWIRENREPTKSELQSMSHEQLREAFAQKMHTEA